MDEEANSAFGFSGTWGEYAPIAFSNLLLTIVTLGIYRFWATTRERKYLWSRTRFIDDRLEWTGTGGELLKGFLLTIVLLGLPFIVLQFVAQALVLQGQAELAGVLSLAAFVAILYILGLARFRALRYRLSRTYWHGIRGGSDNPGFGYGLSYLWKSFVGWLPLGLAVPWSTMSLWNERWRAMSYGPYDFRATGDWGGTMGRFLLFYLLPLALFGGGALLAMGMAGSFATGEAPGGGAILLVFLGVLFFYFLLGLIALAFYAKFFREAVEGLSLDRLDFHFAARTADWLKLFLGDIGLVIVTLGFGAVFLGYRHWKFFVTHLEATGEIAFDELTQSTTRTSSHGEGLLDALDMGAI